jgi:nucleotide-binding universal stress UspA family protein
MEKRILVPLDGSKAGETVLPKLEDLVLKSITGAESEVTFLNVLPIVNFDVLTTDKRAQLPCRDDDNLQRTKEATDYLEKTAASFRKKGYKVKTLVCMGPVAEEIVRSAHDIKASLIAMSTHGHNGFYRWAIGSVTEKVMRLERNIPVLAVDASGKRSGASVLPLDSLDSLVKHT